VHIDADPGRHIYASRTDPGQAHDKSLVAVWRLKLDAITLVLPLPSVPSLNSGGTWRHMDIGLWLQLVMTRRSQAGATRGQNHSRQTYRVLAPRLGQLVTRASQDFTVRSDRSHTCGIGRKAYGHTYALQLCEQYNTVSA